MDLDAGRHATLSDPQGQVCAQSEAYSHGRIRFEAAGTGGFGYDPLFEIEEYRRTFGELGPAAKQPSATGHGPSEP